MDGNSEKYSDLINGSVPVLIDFWATWCGPCRALSPVVEEIEQEYEGRVNVIKCNVDDNEDVAVKYGIRNIPTLLFIKNGEVKDRVVGVVPKSEIASRLDAIL